MMHPAMGHAMSRPVAHARGAAVRRRALMGVGLALALAGFAPVARTDGLAPARLERLYFGRNIGDTGVVSDSAWQAFVRDVVTPAFPAGATVFDAAGQWRAPDGTLVRERTFVLELLHADSAAFDARIAHIIDEYKRRFAQQAVLRIVTDVRGGS